MNRAGRDSTPAAAIWGVVGLAVLLRVALIFFLPDDENPESWEYGAIAGNVAAGNGFSGSSPYEAGPTAAVAPLYPLILAGFMKTGAVHPFLWVQLFQALVFSASLYFLYRLLRMIVPEDAALLTAALGAVYPLSVYYCRLILPSALVFATMVVCLFFTFQSFRACRRREALAAGLSFGVGLLLDPSIAFAFPLLWMYILVKAVRMKALRIFSRQFGWMALAAVVVVCPWTLRNLIVFGEFIPIEKSMGLRLWQGNNPWATGTLWTVDGRKIMDVLNVEELGRLKGMKESEKDEWFLDQAECFIAENPGTFARLYLCRLINFYNPWPPAPYRWIGPGERPGRFAPIRVGAYTVALLSLIPGLWVGLRRGMRALPLLLILLSPAIFHALFYLDNHRYRFPYENLILVFAALALIRLGELKNKMTNPPTTG